MKKRPTSLKTRDRWRIDPSEWPLRVLKTGRPLSGVRVPVVPCPECGALHLMRAEREIRCGHEPNEGRLNLGTVVEIACRAISGEDPAPVGVVEA